MGLTNLEVEMLETKIENESKIISDEVFSKIDKVLDDIEINFDIDDPELDEEIVLDAIREKMFEKIIKNMFSI